MDLRPKVVITTVGTNSVAANDKNVSYRWWFSCRPRFVLMGVLVLFLMVFLDGCGASFEKAVRWPAPGGYWVKNNSPVKVTAVIDAPEESIILECEPDRNVMSRQDIAKGIHRGCFSRKTGVVLLLKGMPPGIRGCVLSHEATGKYSHAAGYGHPGYRETPYIDCGDGTMIVP